MAKHRNTFPNGSKVIPIRLDPVVEAIAKDEANKIGKSISFFINGVVAKYRNEKDGYIISDDFPLE